MLVQCREKAIFLPPDQIFRLVAHTNAIKNVQVWEWNHDNIIVVLNQADMVCKLRVIEQVALATNSAHQFVSVQASLK